MMYTKYIQRMVYIQSMTFDILSKNEMQTKIEKKKRNFKAIFF